MCQRRSKLPDRSPRLRAEDEVILALQPRVELLAQPKNADEPAGLSMFITKQFSSERWEIVSVVLSGLALILVSGNPCERRAPVPAASRAAADGTEACP